MQELALVYELARSRESSYSKTSPASFADSAVEACLRLNPEWLAVRNWRKRSCLRESSCLHYFRVTFFSEMSAGIDGMAIMKHAPPSGRLSASTVPSCASAMDFTMASPRPVPPVPRVRLASVR